VAKIAIIDDDSDFVDLMAAALHEFGHQTVECSEAADAYTRISQELPDLVMTDMKLGPGLDGAQVIRAMRLNTQTSCIPVIVCTGRYDAEIAELWQEQKLPGVRMLFKPFDLADLNRAVTEELAGSKVTRVGSSGE